MTVEDRLNNIKSYLTNPEDLIDDKGDEIEIKLPKPLLSIVTICSEEDKKNMEKWLKWLPKDVRIELVVLYNKQTLRNYLQVIKSEPRLKIIDSEYLELDFSDLRNCAKKYATGKWILSLDMDEYLPEMFKDELLYFLEQDIKEDGFLLNIANNDEKTVTIMHKAVRLFKNTEYADWYGFVHEELINLEKVRPLSITLIHNGYNISSLHHKFKRNLPLLVKQLAIMDIDDIRYNFYCNYLKATLDGFLNEN
jgi:hypothetical protein